MTNHNDTTRILSQIPDEGLFERIATAVLRKAKPALYGNLVHTGMNANNKTVKSPLDGISFVPGANPPHMICAHHTTDKNLDKKWLHDPKTVKPKKGKKPTAPPGDLIKTIQIAEEERKRTPDLQITLALTTNIEPNDELIRNVTAEGRKHGVEVDIWSNSLIANFLDNDPHGQWIRCKLLKIDQELLSKKLLHELSRLSIDTHYHWIKNEEIINRELDNRISDKSSQPIVFVIGESGFGKSTTCYKQLENHIKAGGCGVVLNHEVLATCLTLDQAIDIELRKLHPSLGRQIGAAQTLCSPDNPLLIVIEDLNNADRPAFLLERLAQWSKKPSLESQNDSKENFNWRILCPVCPQHLSLMSDEAKKSINKLCLWADSFNTEEARNALGCKASIVNITLSSIEADSIAEALGNDPLVIGLYDFSEKAEPQQVINTFIEKSLVHLLGNYAITDYRATLQWLARKMLVKRKLNPSWDDIREWFDEKDIAIIRKLVIEHRKIVRLVKNLDNVEQLLFRHDRIRAWLLADAISNLIKHSQLDDTVLSEPFFADVIGAALANTDTSTDIIERVRILNPLALFYAFKALSKLAMQPRQMVLDAIHKWLDNNETHDIANNSLRYAALQVLSETESPDVLYIVKKFPRNDFSTWYALEARFRNGDWGAGIEICWRSEPGVGDPLRDRQIEHAKKYYGGKLTNTLNQFLKKTDLHSSNSLGALRLAGHLADPILTDSIKVCWDSDPEKTKEHLRAYLWAGAQCSITDPGKILDPICDAWAALPEKGPTDSSISPRFNFANCNLINAFRDTLSQPVINYFIEQAKREELHWPIMHMLCNIDHPDAVEYIAQELAILSRSDNGKEKIWQFPIFWQERQNRTGKGMSLASRQRLQTLWGNTDNDDHFRRSAFQLWTETIDTNDLNILKTVNDPALLKDYILWHKVRCKDTTATSALLEKLRDNLHGYWWQHGRYVDSANLANALQDYFCHRRTEALSQWNTAYKIDEITSDLLAHLEQTTAEKLLLEHWDHLQYCRYYIQAALYIATEKTCSLAQDAIKQCPKRKDMLAHITRGFGIRLEGHPGVNRIKQLEGLIPYLEDIHPFCIEEFWRFCNDKGENNWLDFRRTYLDKYVNEKRVKLANFDEDEVFLELDNMVAKNGSIWSDRWLECYLSQHIPLEKIINLLMNWLEKRQTIRALQFVVDVICQAGKRSDFDKICVKNITPQHVAKTIITNSRFILNKRSLV